MSSKKTIRICYFGTYSMEEGYPRNRVIIEGLRKNGVEVIECHEDFWKDTSQKLEGVKAGSSLLKTFYRLLFVYSALFRKFRHIGYYDALIVGYAGHIDIFLAKALNLFRRKPIIFDAFLSLYDTAVMDRKIVSHGSVKAKLLRLIDTWSCRMADVVLLDTPAHVDYFVKEFGLSAEKFHAVPVGSALAVEDENPHPHLNPLPEGEEISLPFKGRDRVGMGFSDEIPKNHARFEILYFGSYIPLHGVDVILKAAKIIQEENPPPLIPSPLTGEGQGGGGLWSFSNETEVIFTMIGTGQLLPSMKQLASELELKNVNFIDRFVEEKELVKYIRRADICLGIFGKTEKALRVIPCKVYNCLQFGKPLITGYTVATEGILKHKDNAYLCRPGDPEDLAKGIVELRNDVKLRENIRTNGYNYFENNFSVEAIGQGILKVIHNII